MVAIPKILEDLKSDDKGLVGVGVLIVFIGIVIVATVAAGVLINTSTAIQGQARDTSRSAMRTVASGIRVLTINGRATRTSDGTRVENIELFVKTRPGSPGINLSKMSIEYVSSDVEQHLTMYENDGQQVAWATREDMYDYMGDPVNENLGDEYFGVVKIKNPSDTDNYMLATPSDMSEIWIDTEAIEGGLKPSQALDIVLMPDTGFKTYATGRCPATMAKQGVFKLRL